MPRSHREASAASAYLSGLFLLESYTTSSYQAVHTFVLTAANGAGRSVRFHWEPVDGVHSAPTAAFLAASPRGCELLSFNPTRLVPGVAVSDDPLLAIRGPAYEHSSCRRLEAAGATNPAPQR